MNKEYETVYGKIFYHFENVPKFMQKPMRKLFMKHRSEVVYIFNKHIGEANKKWGLTGKPAMLGEYIEDINPEYSKFIRDYIQPFIDIANKGLLCKYKIDEYGDIVGYLPFIKKSKLWIDLELI